MSTVADDNRRTQPQEPADLPSSAEQRPTLLMVEDDLGLQKQMRWSFDQYNVVFADNREAAIAQLRRHEPAVVTLDLGLPPDPDTPEEGFRTLEEILSLSPATKVIALTGQNDRANALKAIGMGAYDFFAKPFEPEILSLVLERAFRLADLERENRRLANATVESPLDGLITRDPVMLKLARQVERLAPTSATVLLLGDSGTGKEVFARALHQLSPRKDKRFIAINCAAIPDTLLEAELFGYEKGAFTGASKTTPGKIETADGGTLFLDEIGDLPHPLQAKLLRFLQERVIERIGGRSEIPVDVRVVCATHRNLRELIAEGAFREDLFYRLSEMVLNIPPLRERAGDTALLAHVFVRRFGEANGRGKLTLREDALDAIAAHGWPGNVRELENCIKRAVIMADGSAITAEDLGLQIADEAESLNLRQVREEAERAAVLKVMARVDGNIARAAELLGVSRPTLYDLLNRFGMR
ncbi:PEP-CTERM-box response regulator transcription factor [Quisquiliibacterium transsilvanicum]|uniref:Two-component system NtrC family response regulator n=2 Tax=Quisquiliibacterium transsilvanicum TaxID=1549638 RepID=A0A7W8HDW1_9BURK|nr:two-component system NtrC family response regulator [Quisquiliibacterium transsilvanicum]